MSHTYSFSNILLCVTEKCSLRMCIVSSSEIGEMASMLKTNIPNMLTQCTKMQETDCLALKCQFNTSRPTTL